MSPESRFETFMINDETVVAVLIKMATVLHQEQHNVFSERVSPFELSLYFSFYLIQGRKLLRNNRISPFFQESKKPLMQT